MKSLRVMHDGEQVMHDLARAAAGDLRGSHTVPRSAARISNDLS